MPYIPDDNIPNPKLYSPLTLAFVGDGVYELYVRSRLMALGNISAGKLHKMAIRYVKAKAQAESIMALESELSEEETAIYKRGRNAKSPTVPKNADMTDYRMATGFEALLGFLYLERRSERLSYICKKAYDVHEAENV